MSRELSGRTCKDVLLSFVASNGNDGDIETIASTTQSNALIEHIFYIDFEQIRNIESVKIFNNYMSSGRLIDVTLRIGSSLSWKDNEICATLNDAMIQTYICNLAGRYIFLVLHAENARGNALTFKEIQAFLGDCASCPIYSSSLANSMSVKDCECDPGYTGQNGGVCNQCPLGTNKLERGRHACKCYADSYAINDISGLLLREKPYIVSDAADWNTVTQRFDSKCGMQTCAGNTGARNAGIVTTGTIAGHGAGAPVFFVGGTVDTQMQWGAGSIPADFTICSVTRYSGPRKVILLTCDHNPAGNADWYHGHFLGRAGSNYYGSDYHKNLGFSVANVDNWVTMCGRNLLASGRDGIIVNDIVRASALGGDGNCALGINFRDESDWQLSKLYIWDYHLSDVDFAMASSLIYAALLTNTETNVCLACPPNSHSANGSMSITECKCDVGYSGRPETGCTKCAIGKYRKS